MTATRLATLVLLIALALGACSEEKAPPTTATGDNPEQPDGGQVGDHWHAAFGVQVCGDLLQPIADVRADRTGLHSHSDGLIHIHPFSARSAGDGATMAAFFDTVGYEASADALITPQGELKASVGCDGERATVRLLVDGDEWEGDIEAFRPLDGQVLQLLFDTPDAPAVDLPWADSVRSPSDVQAMAGLPGPNRGTP